MPKVIMIPQLQWVHAKAMNVCMIGWKNPRMVDLHFFGAIDRLLSWTYCALIVKFGPVGLLNSCILVAWRQLTKNRLDTLQGFNLVWAKCLSTEP